MKTRFNSVLLLILAAFLSAAPAFSQRDSVLYEDGPDDKTPIQGLFDPRKDSDLCLFHFKVLPYPSLGNGGGFNVLAGVEYGFSRVHSLSVDMARTNLASWSDVYDSASGQFVSGLSNHLVDWSWMLSYRHYLRLYRFRDKGGRAPYLLLMLRYGRRHYWFDEGYPKWYDGPERLSESEEHYSGALAFGFSETFGLDHLAFDIQAGISFKEKFFHAVYAQEEGTYADDHQAWYVLPRLGFSFCWFFLR